MGWAMHAELQLVERQSAGSPPCRATLAAPAAALAARVAATACTASSPCLATPSLSFPQLFPSFLYLPPICSYDMTVRLWDYAAPEDALVRVRKGLCMLPTLPLLMLGARGSAWPCSFALRCTVHAAHLASVGDADDAGALHAPGAD